MKLIMEQWRGYLSEDQRGNMKKILNLPDILVQWFHDKFGGKNAFLVAKWWIQNTFVEFRENYKPPRYPDKRPYSDRIWHAVMVSDLLPKLVHVGVDDVRRSMYAQNPEFEPLREYYGDKLRRVMDSRPDLQYILGKQKYILSTNLEFFETYDIIRDIRDNKVKNVAAFKNLNFHDATQKYADAGIQELKTVKTYEDGFRWIDTQARRCQIVKTKMKNCGSTGFHSPDPNATMLLLVDENDIPHVVVTWEPKYKKLSYPEGQAGSLPKQKYWSKIKDLIGLYGAKSVTHTNIWVYGKEEEQEKFRKYVSVGGEQ
jgi:hypothetical protein